MKPTRQSKKPAKTTLSAAARSRRKVHAALDLGDRKHSVAVLDTKSGDLLEEIEIPNGRDDLRALAARWPRAVFVMEAGTHSPWISRLLRELGHEVLVANPRKTRMIWQSDRKCDRRDAYMLAKIARMDPELLHPVVHQSEEAQFGMIVLKSRDALVGVRTKLVNTVRGLLKSFGHRVPRSIGADAFSRKARPLLEEQLPELGVQLAPLLDTLDEIQKQIRSLDRSVADRIATGHPKAARLQQIHGVGPITALCFELVMDEEGRFGRIRDAGAYLGLVPRRDQSGDLDKQLGITKAGHSMLRRLLVGSARYINGPFGRDCDLRRHGHKLAARGGRGASGKAAIAVARKLAVVMAVMLRDGADYRPLAADADAKAAAIS